MVAPHSPAFRRHALELVRAGDRSLAKIALDIGVSETTLRKWARVDAERDSTPDTVARRELAELARQIRTLEVEVDLLKRATATPRAPRGRRAY